MVSLWWTDLDCVLACVPRFDTVFRWPLSSSSQPLWSRHLCSFVTP